MKKLFIFLSMMSFLIASDIKEIKNIKDLSSNKDIILMFSISSCPWCIKQFEVLEKIKKDRDLQIVKVKKGSGIYKELIEKYPFPVDFYPTSFIVIKEDNEISIKYEFQGYQRKSNIIKVLKSFDDF